MKSLLKKIVILATLTLLLSCSWKWEPLSSDYEPVLNVYGVLSLDAEIPSFVYVTRTLTLQDSAQKVIGRDTIWYSERDYWISETYRSNFLVMDAEVIISDGTQDYHLHPVQLKNSGYWIDDSTYIDQSPNIPFYFNGTESYVYMDSSGLFQAKPETEYSIEVKSSDYPVLSGLTKTPAIPTIINWDSLPDTLKSGTGYTIRWQPIDSGNFGVIQYQSGDWGDNVRRIITESDSAMTFVPELSEYYFESIDEERTDIFTLTLRYMDNNYYELFVKGQSDEIFSFVLGATNRQLTYGVEGGIGAFTAFSQITIKKAVN